MRMHRPCWRICVPPWVAGQAPQHNLPSKQVIKHALLLVTMAQPFFLTPALPQTLQWFGSWTVTSRCWGPGIWLESCCAT